MNVTAGTAGGGLSKQLFSEMGCYRNKVFVETLGWDLQLQDGQELDQFDRPDTLYVVSQDDDGRVNGCARLLPTNRPYLLGEVFPQLMNGQPVPCSADVWELSRFASVDFAAGTVTPLSQFSASVAAQLLHESIRYAAAHGAKRLITVSPIGIERLLRRTGVHAHRAGPPMIVNGHPIFACWIEIDSAVA
ncbi:N-acyl-L-homoserine lactone synthetase [Duganella sp. CF458]|uniref:acyl-homoserine-lactone synthase n=1 Tax=Duganella sp. CF458 TaxID=1884368 RepID=UPI0008ECE414|nr:acyl-homoserine-lactone synthase [Duganella sp. CF458]SFH02482.1 N-acyl-L-homoserine lactone synthetase [Duganella sp. CF458]